MPAPKSTTHTWLQLLRAPNLFTVPGDPLAGFLLVSGGAVDGRLFAAILASLCFYAHGLLLNDLADLEEDRRDRPRRPLPSGGTSVGRVKAVAAGLAAFALILTTLAGGHTFAVGLALLTAVIFYNLWAKRFAVLGPTVMGLCRGLSLLLGAVAAQAHAAIPLLPLLAVATLTLYIALVTNLARIETHYDPPKGPRTLPFIGLLATVLPIFFLALDYTDLLHPLNIGLYAVSAYTLYIGFQIHRRLLREPAPPIPPIIGQLIRLLLPLQALWCLASRSATGVAAAAILLILWPVSRQVSRRFYAS